MGGALVYCGFSENDDNPQNQSFMNLSIMQDFFHWTDCLQKQEWFCEVALWAEWKNMGKCMAFIQTCMMRIAAKPLAKVLRKHEDMFAVTMLYAAKFCEVLEASRDTRADLRKFELVCSSCTSKLDA